MYWEIMAYFLAQFPTLFLENVSAFTYLYPNITLAELGSPVASFEGGFALSEPVLASALEDLWAPF